MTDRDALLAGVVAAPADDHARLVYADYLDEHGGAADRTRAEFIRLMVGLGPAAEIHGTGDRLLPPAATRDYCRAVALLDVRSRGFLGRAGGVPLAHALALPLGVRHSLVWSRGFVSRVPAPYGDDREALPWFMRHTKRPYAEHLVRTNPVEYVGVAFTPEGSSGAGLWFWMSARDVTPFSPPGRWYLPDELFDRLNPDTHFDPPHGPHAYPSEEAARNDLSAAAIKLLRGDPPA